LCPARYSSKLEYLGERRDRVAAAGGEMLGAVFSFFGELVSLDETQSPAEPLVAEVRNRLTECEDEDAAGRQRLTVTLPNRNTLNALAQTLVRPMLAGNDNMTLRE
jgi:hypothetical protein